MNDSITQAVVTAAEHVPGDLLTLGATTVERRPHWSRSAEAGLIGASPAPLYIKHAEVIARTWATLPETPGVAIASAIRAAVAAVASARAVNQVSLVWTGPPTKAVGLRYTRSVLNELVADATESLVLVSFASYKVDDLAARLVTAAERGVDVSLILETHDDSGGALTFDAANAFAALQGKARFYRWPLEAREAYLTSSARLHAKCVIADRTTALITSANLTSAGINDNIELGVLVEAGPLPAKLHDHLALLIEEGTLGVVP